MTGDIQASLDNALNDALSRIDADAELLKEIDAALGFVVGETVQQWQRLDRIRDLRAQLPEGQRDEG